MQSTPKTGETFWLWFTKIISGAIVLFVLGTHLIVNHFLAPKGLLTHAEVVAYFQNPLVVFMEAVFLLLLVLHSLLGLRGILLDLRPTEKSRRVIDIIIILFGVFVSLYGLWLLNAVRTMSS